MTTFYPFRSRRRYASGGINEEHTWWVKCEAVGKARHKESPYLFANEWIAGNIAQFLRLPIPPFSLLAKRSKSTSMFCSYSFQGDSTPSDVNPQILYQKHPDLCVGILLFDMLVLNCDRHGGNLKVDDPADPKDFFIFDHERALLYIYQDEGVDRLMSRIDRLGITDGSGSGDEWHCIIEEVDSIPLIRKWAGKIAMIPDWFIKDICHEVWKLGIVQEERDAVANFLNIRKIKLCDLISQNKDRFPKIRAADWPLILCPQELS